MNEPEEFPTNKIENREEENLKRQKVSHVVTSPVKDLDYEDPLLPPFPVKAVSTKFRYPFIPNGRDPRGVVLKDGAKLSIGSCPSCRCEYCLCHKKRFGLYCGLRVAEQIEEIGIANMSGDKIKPLMKIACNEILWVKTVQNVGVLDTHNKYEPPECMKERSMKNSRFL